MILPQWRKGRGGEGAAPARPCADETETIRGTFPNDEDTREQNSQSRIRRSGSALPEPGTQRLKRGVSARASRCWKESKYKGLHRLRSSIVENIETRRRLCSGGQGRPRRRHRFGSAENGEGATRSVGELAIKVTRPGRRRFGYTSSAIAKPIRRNS